MSHRFEHQPRKGESLPAPPAVHLSPAKGRTDSAEDRAYRLGDLAGAFGTGCSRIFNVLEFLDVENSPRYRLDGVDAFCNIYAYDFCCLCDVYLPRVWWLEPAEATLLSPVTLGTTVRELRANDLHDWLLTWGKFYGWTVETSLPTQAAEASSELQRAVDGRAGVGLVVGRRFERERNGHISVVIPQDERRGYLAGVDERRAVVPLQSQAGMVNQKASASRWFDDPRRFDSLCFAFCPLPH